MNETILFKYSETKAKNHSFPYVTFCWKQKKEHFFKPNQYLYITRRLLALKLEMHKAVNNYIHEH